MASAHPDVNPLGGSSRGGKGMKNVDGREKGAEWNKQVKPAFADKSVGVQPNEGAPHLPSPTVSGEKV